MRANLYLNFAITMLIIVIIGGAFFLVNSFDDMRFTIEEVNTKLDLMRDDISDLKSDFNEKDFTINPAKQGIGMSIEKKDKNLTKSNIVNWKFFIRKAPSGGIIKGAISSETSNLNDIIQNESQVSAFWAMCNSTLAARNYEKPEIFSPLIAESWSISEDKLIYHIKIKKNVLWHDFVDPVSGKKWVDKEVTSEDFKFYVDVIKNKNVNCPQLRTYFKSLKKIEIIGKYEFKVYWDKKYFLTKSITLELSPLPKHLYYDYEGEFNGKKFNEDYKRNAMIIGCGPYYLDKVVKRRRYIFKRFEKYFGRRYGIMPKVAELRYDVVKLPNTRLQMLKSKKLDQLGLIPDQWKNNTSGKEFSEKDGFLKKLRSPGRSYSYVAWNQKNQLFKDKRVRQAMTRLIDREHILKFVYNDLARITTGPFVIDSPFYNENIKKIKFSVADASKLLKQAGWDDRDGDGILENKAGKSFEFTFMIPGSSSTYIKIAEIIKESMSKAGVKVNILQMEWSVFIERLNKKSFDACMLGWSTSYESDPYQIWHSSQADIKGNSSNFISFRNKKADELIMTIRETFDLEKRAKLCKAFHKLISEEQPYTFMFVSDYLMAYNKRLKNVQVFPLEFTPKDIIWIQK